MFRIFSHFVKQAQLNLGSYVDVKLFHFLVAYLNMKGGLNPIALRKAKTPVLAFLSEKGLSHVHCMFCFEILKGSQTV